MWGVLKHNNSVKFLFQDYWNPSLLGEVYEFVPPAREELVIDLKFVNIVSNHLVSQISQLQM